ncbi:CHAD domain-containing protein [Methyloligella halotolerans]|uniref:CHAD domain-containing protein n=1 Tax=Methyloligella halotolerans TaxID=1177755 RepID=UPI001ABB6D5B|nr:CHAD domain-containing protein [Methyloligella halotolerans]
MAKSQVDKAIAEIDDSDLGLNDTIHQVRKRCKKLRGLIRLVRPGFDDYAKENAAFREAAGSLSVLRDSEAMLETHDALMDFYADRTDAPVYASVRNRLVERQEEAAENHGLEERLAVLRDRLSDAKPRIEKWEIEGNGFAAAADGLRKTYKRGRDAMAEAAERPAPNSMHEWRKRVKYHRYHAQLLSDIWPAAMETHVAAAKSLGDVLGDHHDLAVLQEALPSLFGGETDEMKAYLGLAQGRQALLASQALHCGQRVFAEKPSALTRRWRHYWDAWQAGHEDAHLLQAA